MEEHLSDFQISAQSASDILFPALLWYLEFLVVSAAFVIACKIIQNKYNKH